MPADDEGQVAAIAAEWGVDPELLEDTDWTLETIDGNDGELYGYIVRFDDTTDRDLLDRLGVPAGRFERQLSLSALEDLNADRAAKIEEMVEWFFENFEDPAESTPYETAEGGYQWIWGGPYDATEELENQFSDVDSKLIEAAVAEIEKDGLTEWAPANPEFPVDEEREDEPADDQKSEEQLRAEIEEDLRAVDEAVEQLRDIVRRTHNNPPEYLDDLPDLEPVSIAVAATRELLAQPSPPAVALIEQASAFRKIGDLLRSPLGIVGEVVFGGIVFDALKHDYTAIKTLYGAVVSVADKLTAFSDLVQGLL